MTKAKYPESIESATIISTEDSIEDISGILGEYLKYRKIRMNTQFQLLRSCENDDDLKRLEANGLINFDSTAI
jgi:hypothetical protein